MFHQTWHFFLVALAGFINRQQQDVIATTGRKTASSVRNSVTSGSS